MQRNCPIITILHLVSSTLVLYLTVGAHTASCQQLGLRRSCPVYLACKPVKNSYNLVTSAYQVTITLLGSPIPLKPSQIFFTALVTWMTLFVTFFGKVSGEACGVAVLTLCVTVPCGRYGVPVLAILRKLGERGRLYL